MSHDVDLSDLRFPRRAKVVAVMDDGVSAARQWWSTWWLPLSVFMLLAVVGFLFNFWWLVGQQTDSDGDALIRFFDSLVGIAAVFFGGSVTIATIYSATRSARAVKMAEERAQADRLAGKKGRLDALIGASLEVGAYGAWMAEIQFRSRKVSNRLFPEPMTQRELVLASWRQLSAAAVAASKALERIRYEDPDVFELAGRHYDLVTELQQAAFEGEPDRLQEQAANIRTSADELWAGIQPSARESL